MHARLLDKGRSVTLLDPIEWDFTNVPKNQLTACFFWEYCREKIELRYVFDEGKKPLSRLADLRITFLQHRHVFSRLAVRVEMAKTPPDESEIPCALPWQALDPKIRTEIAQDFQVFFQPIELIMNPEDNGYWDNADARFRMMSLFIDWGYSDAIIKRRLLSILDLRPKKLPPKLRTLRNLSTFHALAPDEDTALGWLGALRCIATLRPDKKQFGASWAADYYHRGTKGSGAAQLAMEAKDARRILLWLEKGHSNHLMHLRKNWKRLNKSNPATANK